MISQRKGFEQGTKYVFEERLSGGRLLVHLFGDEYNKRIIPLGCYFKNKLYMYRSNDIGAYNGNNFIPFPNSILTCEVSSKDSLMFSGLFNMSGCIDDYLGFKEGIYYTYKGKDRWNNIEVVCDITGDILKIPKGALFQNGDVVADLRVYDGYNCVPKNRLYCQSVLDDLLFIGDFSKFDPVNLAKKVEEAHCNECPNCKSMLHSTIPSSYSISSLGGFEKAKEEGSEVVHCPNCGYINIKVSKSITEITYFGDKSKYWVNKN